MADTIAVMHDGRIEQAGGAADLYERPRTEFVANFLGVSNLIDGKLGATQGGLSTVETHDGARLRVPSDRVGPHDTDSIRVGVRPEKITLRRPPTARPDGDDNSLRGTVVVAAFLGTSIQYVIKARGRRGADRLRPEPRRRRAGLVRARPRGPTSPGTPTTPSSSARSSRHE